MPRRAARRDANHKAVIGHLSSLGWSVLDLGSVGDGCPDAAVGMPGFAALVEIKDGDKPPSARKLTPAEREFAERWTGPYIVALSPDDAERQLVALRNKWIGDR